MLDNTMQFNYHLDTCERTGNPSGNVTVIVQTDNGQILDASLVKCTLEDLRTHCTAIYEGLGDVKVIANEHGSLFDYEFIHSEMQQELDAANERLEAERLHYELEQKRKTAKKVLDVLSTQEFDDFYTGVFNDYIEGGDITMSEEGIIDIIAKKFL